VKEESKENGEQDSIDKKDPNLQQAIELRMQKSRSTDFFLKLSELTERIEIFQQIFLSKEPKYIHRKPTKDVQKKVKSQKIIMVEGESSSKSGGVKRKPTSFSKQLDRRSFNSKGNQEGKQGSDLSPIFPKKGRFKSLGSLLQEGSPSGKQFFDKIMSQDVVQEEFQEKSDEDGMRHGEQELKVPARK